MQIINKLSKLEDAYFEYKEKLNALQQQKLIVNLSNYKQYQEHDFIQATINDEEYSSTAWLVGAASKTLKDYIDNTSILIKLLSWQIIFNEKKQIYEVLILDFSFLRKNKHIHECPEFNPEQFFKQQSKAQNSQQKKIKTQNLQKFEGQVLKKSPLLQYYHKQSKKTLNYFQISVLDFNQEILKCVFFNKAVQQYFGAIQVGTIYSFNTNTIPNEDIIINQYSIITEHKDQVTKPLIPKFKFTNIQMIQNSKAKVFDILAIISKLTQQVENKKTYIVYDQTGSISLTLDSGFVEKTDFRQGELIAFSNLKYYKSKNSMNSDICTFQVQNVSSEFQQLKQWSLNNAANNIIVQDPIGENKQYIIGKIIQNDTDENSILYPVCRQCPNQIINQIGKSYFCPKCKTIIDQAKYNFNLSVTIVTKENCFRAKIPHQIAELFLGKTADQFVQLSVKQQFDLLYGCQEKDYRFEIDQPNLPNEIQKILSIDKVHDINDQHYEQEEDFDLIKKLDDLELLDEL